MSLPATDRALLHDVYSGRLLPREQRAAFDRLPTIFPTRTIARGDGPERPLPASTRTLPPLCYRSHGKSCDLYDYVSRNRTMALLVLKDGARVFEHYEDGLGADSRWVSMSMAKSVTSILVGAAIADGLIGGIDDPLVDYLPQLIGSGYDGVTIRQLLQMASGVAWNEDYTDPASDRRRMLDLQVAQEPGAIIAYMATLPRIAEPGTRWCYSTGETHVAGALVRAATGRPVADYLSRTIWSRLGMAQNATWWLEASDGLEVAGSGMAATLQDYARFAAFVAADGVIDGARVLPQRWVAASGGCAVPAPGRGHYGLMWWPIADGDGSYTNLAFRAGGIFGQYLYVNPAERVVIAVWSMRSKPMGAEAIEDNDFFNAVVAALR